MELNKEEINVCITGAPSPIVQATCATSGDGLYEGFELVEHSTQKPWLYKFVIK
jgi:hypothetical protein